MNAPLGLDASTTQLQEGCSARSTKLAKAAFFCDYVLSVMRQDPAYTEAYQAMNQTGGLKIYTTLDPVDQRAAQHAVNYMLPAPPNRFNPAGNAATEVLIQPGTGRVRAIALDRPYGTGPGQTNVDYAVDTRFNGGQGVQTGSSSKLFTLLTALKQGVPFGFNMKVSSPESILGVHQLQRAADHHAVPGEQLRGPQQAGGVHPLQRHHAVHQRVLRQPGAEGRAVQRGEDRGRAWACTARTAPR